MFQNEDSKSIHLQTQITLTYVSLTEPLDYLIYKASIECFINVFNLMFFFLLNMNISTHLISLCLKSLRTTDIVLF